MAKRAASRKTLKSKKPTNLPCSFCKLGKDPDYKDYQTLGKYVTDRARIVGSRHSGLCSKHQRRTTKAIKRARHLGLLPFTPTL